MHPDHRLEGLLSSRGFGGGSLRYMAEVLTLSALRPKSGGSGLCPCIDERVGERLCSSCCPKTADLCFSARPRTTRHISPFSRNELINSVSNLGHKFIDISIFTLERQPPVSS